MKTCFIFVILYLGTSLVYAQTQEVIHLWPDAVPGETEVKHPPVQTDNTSGNTIRISDITDPALVVYPAPKENNKGIGIIVSPGGGYRILAIDKEGYEIAEWLNSLGYTAFVLQYRVPDKREGALQDIQRALRIVKSKAKQWQIDPEKIGAMGFSAGASLSARASTRYMDKTYPIIDGKDKLDCRPAFAMLIYPGGMDSGENKSLSPEIKPDQNTPPMFVFATADDRHGNGALVISQALRNAKVPVELHMLPTGGHGYGLRKGNIAGETWPVLAEKWLKRLY